MTLPYTAAYVGGLQLGLSTADLRKMPYPRLILMLRAASEGRGGEAKPSVREATQADIDSFLA
jgi:hypothetical protein